ELEALVGLLRELGALAVDIEQLGVTLVAREDRLERGERVQVVGLERERAAEVLDALVALAEPVLGRPRDLGRELVRDLRIELLGLPERFLEQRAQTDPAVIEQRRERFELRLRRFDRRVLAERARVRIERLLGVHHLRALQLADAQQQRRPAQLVLLRREL